MSYNDARGEPNWVSWQVTAADQGTAKRKQTFDPDDTMPAGFHRVVTRDYTQCGFDRGHMCPDGDRKATTEMSFATFVMSNVVPQAPDLNRVIWEHLEAWPREQVRSGNTAYVVAGPLGQGGLGEATTVGNGRIAVPAMCWKIVLLVPAGGGDDRSQITAQTRVVAVLMPNRQGINPDWQSFLCTVADIEQRTGYHFFDQLPPDVVAVLRAKRDSGGRQ